MLFLLSKMTFTLTMFKVEYIRIKIIHIASRLLLKAFFILFLGIQILTLNSTLNPTVILQYLCTESHLAITFFSV